MATITFKENNPKDDVKFPLLRRNKTSPLVVMFFNYNSGIVIKSGDTFPVGHYYCNWVRFDVTEVWVPIHGEVIFDEL